MLRRLLALVEAQTATIEGLQTELRESSAQARGAIDKLEAENSRRDMELRALVAGEKNPKRKAVTASAYSC